MPAILLLNFHRSLSPKFLSVTCGCVYARCVNHLLIQRVVELGPIMDLHLPVEMSTSLKFISDRDVIVHLHLLMEETPFLVKYY